MPDALRIARWQAVGRRVVFLEVAQAAMAVAAYRNQVVAVCPAGDVVQFKRKRIVVTAHHATRVVATQSFKRSLPTTDLRAIGMLP